MQGTFYNVLERVAKLVHAHPHAALKSHSWCFRANWNPLFKQECQVCKAPANGPSMHLSHLHRMTELAGLAIDSNLAHNTLHGNIRCHHQVTQRIALTNHSCSRQSITAHMPSTDVQEPVSDFKNRSNAPLTDWKPCQIWMQFPTAQRKKSLKLYYMFLREIKIWWSALQTYLLFQPQQGLT